MDCNQLRKWREHQGLKVSEAAALLDIAENTYNNYERGFRYMAGGAHQDVPVPKSVELACAAISLGIREYKGGALKIR